jgi:hypothetical protein
MQPKDSFAADDGKVREGEISTMPRPKSSTKRNCFSVQIQGYHCDTASGLGKPRENEEIFCKVTISGPTKTVKELGEKRDYGELHLRKLQNDYEIMVENQIAKGERHELLLLTKKEGMCQCLRWRSRGQPSIVQLTMPHIEDGIVPDRKEDHMEKVPENTSPSKDCQGEGRTT